MEYLTVKEVADVLRVHEQTVRRLVKEGEIPDAIRLGSGGAWKIPLAGLEKYLGANRDRVVSNNREGG